MTDEITCPECQGSGESPFGTLRLACQFCHGRGVVGGEHEPAGEGELRTDGYRQPYEGESYDPQVHGPLPRVADNPVVRESGLCPTCLGAGVLISPAQVETPCPACSE